MMLEILSLITCKSNESNLFIIIDKDPEDNFYSVVQLENSPLDFTNTISIDPDECVPTDCIKERKYILINSLSRVSILEISNILGKIKQVGLLSEIFRSLTKYFAKKSTISSISKKNDYLHPSGKVINEDDISSLVDASLDGWLTTGRFNDRFEKELSGFLGVKYSLTVNSGSSANLVALTALSSSELGNRQLVKGDEVITLAAGFPTTIAPILQNGFVPVFVDITPGHYNIDVKQIEESLTDSTRAIMVAHTLGNPFDLDAVVSLAKKHNLWLIEDNCDAIGSKYNGQYTGTFGDIGTSSFYPAHHITMGEGGAVYTNNSKLNKIMMSIRDWGRDCWCPPGKDNTCKRRFIQKHGNLPEGYDHKYVYSHLGYNLKISDMQASVGCSQLKKLPEFIEKRKKNFDILNNQLSILDDRIVRPISLEESDPSWFGYMILIKDKSINRNEVVRQLDSEGIGTRLLFAGNLLRQPVFVNNKYKYRIRNSGIINSDDVSKDQLSLLPNTDSVMENAFWVGLWPGLSEENIFKIAQSIIRVFNY
jgi:CDP-6-deoxy-D-xylo-4-hexulose-3-dehydrase